MSFELREGYRARMVMAVSALIVSYARQVVQYGQYGYSSLWEFLGLWLVHYIGLFFGTIGYLVAIRWARSFAFGETAEEYGRLETEQLMVQFATAVAVVAVAILVLAHLPAMPDD